MRQALLIFRKDVHHLWPRALPLLVVSALLGWLESKYLGAGPLFDLLRGLWLLSALFLIASAVHQEHLPGHQQYWLTRPYSRLNLLLAKLFFLTAFIILPEFAMEAFSLAANRVSPLHYLPRLVSTALIFAGASGLIFTAIAAVTENLGELLWALLPAIGLPIMGATLVATSYDTSRNWLDVEWVRLTALGLALLSASLAVLFLQYRHRETAISRGVLGGALLLTAVSPFLGSWHTARRIQSALFEHAADPSVAQISFDIANHGVPSHPDPTSRSARPMAKINLPILMTGIPAGAQAMVERTSIRIDTPDGRSWTSDWPQHTHAYESAPTQISHGMPANGGYWQFLNVDDEFYRAVKDVPVHLHTSTALVLVSRSKTIDLAHNGDTGPLADGGFCNVSPGPFDHLIVGCVWPGGPPPLAFARVRSLPTGPVFVSLLALGKGSPFSLNGSVWDGGGALISDPHGKMEVQLEIWQSAVHFDRDVDIPQIRLADYHAPGIRDLR